MSTTASANDDDDDDRDAAGDGQQKKLRSTTSHRQPLALKNMAIQIGEKVLSANGSTRYALSQNGGSVEWKTSVQTSMPWQPNSYDENSNTLDFCFRPTAEIIAFVLQLESEVLKQVFENSEAYFGAKMDPAVLKLTFQTSLKTSQKGTEHFKTKGRYANIKCWDSKGKLLKETTASPDDWFHFVVCAKALWFNEKAWGINFDLLHLQIFQAKCPF